MKLKLIKPPREFVVGFKDHRVTLKDCAHIELSADEQITFFTESGGEYDITRKSWGFYATPSLNSRLPRYHLRPAFLKNRVGHFFIVLIEKGKEPLFQKYLELERLNLIAWLDDPRSLGKLEKLFHEKRKKN